MTRDPSQFPLIYSLGNMHCFSSQNVPQYDKNFFAPLTHQSQEVEVWIDCMSCGSWFRGDRRREHEQGHMGSMELVLVALPCWTYLAYYLRRVG